MADFLFQNHGSITILTPRSDAGRQWIDDHIPADATTWCSGIVIEPRYAQDILDGIEADGLEVS
jgi:hypothetical protein